MFCWRHHKNPVGREWRWETDSPEMLVTGAIERHQQMVRELKGMPGVIPERLDEAMTVAHCALSLVGEPIMYPYIAEFCKYLHERKISTFLVTNAQVRLVPKKGTQETCGENMASNVQFLLASR